jgi:hypothetical protein
VDRNDPKLLLEVVEGVLARRVRWRRISAAVSVTLREVK